MRANDITGSVRVMAAIGLPAYPDCMAVNATTLDRPSRRMRRRSVALALLSLSIALFALDLLGLRWYEEVRSDQGLPAYEITPPAQRLGRDEFWAGVERVTSHEPEARVRELKTLISQRTVYLESRQIRPTIAENWILWAYALQRGRYTWSSPERAIKAGGGYCDQHSVILQGLLLRAGIPSRIVTLSGHVLNEVQLGGRWRVVDSTFDVMFDRSIEELSRTPDAVFQAYVDAGQTPANARRWTDALVSLNDNRTEYRIEDYVGRPYYVEKLAIPGVWIIPALLAAMSLLLIRRKEPSACSTD
jgi:hypothetical protein